MSENLGREHPMVQGDDDFERRLFAMIAAGELDFPKGVVRPGDEAAPRGGVLASFRARLARLRPRLPRLFLTAAVAYGLALVVSLPAYLVIFPRAPVSTPPALAVVPPPASTGPAIGSARFLELGAGPTRAPGVASQITVDPSDAFVVLSFLAPIRSGPGIVHQATLTDSAGRVVAVQKPIESVDDIGNFVLVCRADLFSTGEYRLALTEVSARAATSGESHRFSFHVSRPRN